VKGKIVFFDHPMPPFTPGGGAHYDETVTYRNSGPAHASRLGAVAVLVRTVTARSLRSPHTGDTRFEDGATPIPAAAISIEDADLITRLLAAGEPVKVHLTMGAETLPPAASANVIGELRGREHPEEIVLIGAHLDSWDVGQGAHDDGAGCVTVMQALTLLRRLGLTPRRTIRVVLFTNEENGVAGGKEYFRAHRDELEKHVVAMESDSGGFAPRGFDVHALGRGRDETIAQVADIAGLLSPIHATKVQAGYGGTDAEEATGDFVPQLGLDVDESTYFDYHHSQADTLDKVDPALLRDDVAAMAVMAYVIADMPEKLTSRSR
jgi:Zn-dependent M28 family amino/carboxypeptidase